MPREIPKTAVNVILPSHKSDPDTAITLRGKEKKMTITEGKLTYDAEGNEGGRYHSRVLHAPGENSGLTIGRGYDMKEKSTEKIDRDLTNAGVDADMAAIISRASGLAGSNAKNFITENGLKTFEISMETQEILFKTVYAELAGDVKRICNKADCVAAYGAVDWDGLNPLIKDVLIDLRFRGDYYGKTRKKIQTLAAKNDAGGFARAMNDASFWKDSCGVPPDRFDRRVKYLENVL